MDRENSPTAAYEVWSLSLAHVAKLQGAVDAVDGGSKPRRALRAAKNRGAGVPEAQAVVEKAEAASRDSSEKAWALVLDTTSNRTFTSLHRAGNQAIIRACQILSGKKTPTKFCRWRARWVTSTRPSWATLIRPWSTACSHDRLLR